jgi:hypothetical protein
MAKKSKAKHPRVNRRDLTLANLKAYKRDLKLITEALKSVDKRLHLVEANLAALLVPAVEPTDDGVRITLADDGA